MFTLLSWQKIQWNSFLSQIADTNIPCFICIICNSSELVFSYSQFGIESAWRHIFHVLSTLKIFICNPSKLFSTVPKSLLNKHEKDHSFSISLPFTPSAMLHIPCFWTKYHSPRRRYDMFVFIYIYVESFLLIALWNLVIYSESSERYRQHPW